MDAPPAAAPPPTRPRRALTLLLLIAGVAFYACLQRLGSDRRHHTTWDWPSLGVAAACFAVAFVPYVNTVLIGAIERCSAALAGRRGATTVVITVVAALVLFASAVVEHRAFFPRNHDEHMYLIQAQQMARFRLWLPQHELADFFETFHVLVKPRYASIYFPGASLLYVPAIWLHVPTWVESLLISGLIVGLAYRVVAELLHDDAAGVLAGVMILSLPRFRQFSLMIMSHTVVLLLGLLMVWAYLRWRRGAKEGRASLGYAALLGMFGGWAAVTRPMDALCFAVPIGGAFVLDLARAPQKGRTILVGLLAALPLLSLQLIADKGITGQWTKLPASLFAERYWPELGMGYHAYQPDRVPPTPLEQFHRYYAEFIQPRVKAHQPGHALATFVNERLPLTIVTDLPSKLLAILLPVGLMGLTTLPRWALALSYPLFVALYTPFLFFLPHYTIPVVAAVGLLVLLGRRGLAASFPRVGERVALGTALAIVAFSAVAFTQSSTKPLTGFDTLRDVRQKLAGIPGRAVVLFRFAPSDDYMQEPVYNVTTADIDEARVIRAHDLGAERDAELFRYYRRRQPDRAFYLYDRGTHEMTQLKVGAEEPPP